MPLVATRHFDDPNAGLAVMMIEQFHIAISELARYRNRVIAKDTPKASQMNTRHSIAELNALSAADFTRVVGPVFEHSPWIASETAAQRPFADREKLLAALCETIRLSSDDQKLALIRAHPDLVGRMALAGKLTAASTREQAAAGLNQLTPDEVALFRRQNTAYQQKFGFPFVICARLNHKDAILTGFERRLQNSREDEIHAALQEIFKIAALRLRDLMED
jgi:2-oxo-4-hydroxy-4-carboxy-5-ureidoimidazoline decarboxylase